LMPIYYTIKKNVPLMNVYSAQEINVDLFLHRFFDFSSFSFYNLGTSFSLYTVEFPASQFVMPCLDCYYTAGMAQCNKRMNEQLVVKSLD